MLKLKFQYFGYLMQTANSLKKSLMLGEIEGRRRREQQRMRWLDGITDSMDMILGKTPRDGEGLGGLACCSPWGRKELDTTWWLSNNKKGHPGLHQLCSPEGKAGLFRHKVSRGKGPTPENGAPPFHGDCQLRE